MSTKIISSGLIVFAGELLLGFPMLNLVRDIIKKIRKVNTRFFHWLIKNISIGVLKKKLKSLESIMIQQNSKFTHIELIQFLSFVNVVILILCLNTGYVLLGITLPLSLSCFVYHYVLYKYYKHLHKVNIDLNFSLSLITSSYVKNHDLIKSIRTNLHRMPGEIKEVFSDFLVRAEIIDSDLIKGVKELKKGINNYYFTRWCDILIQCVDDRDYIEVLPAVVSEMNEINKNAKNFELMVEKTYKDFFQLVLITAITPLMLRVTFPEMYITLMYTSVGKFIVAMVISVLLVTSSKVLIVNKPINNS